MNMAQALNELGAADGLLDDAEVRHLDEEGYLPLPGLLSAERVAALRARVQALIAEEADQAGLEFAQEPGTQRLSNLVDKDPLFEICFSHPRVLAAVNHVLNGDFKLSSLNGRAALPGEGLQALHADWGSGVEPGAYQVCNSIWLLVDFTEANGATRIVPGSHRSRQVPRDEMADPRARHPDEILLKAEAGTVVVFNSHIWHGGTVNRTDAPRYALHSYFTRRQHAQQVDQAAFLSDATRERLSPAQRFILDV